MDDFREHPEGEATCNAQVASPSVHSIAHTAVHESAHESAAGVKTNYI